MFALKPDPTKLATLTGNRGHFDDCYAGVSVGLRVACELLPPITLGEINTLLDIAVRECCGVLGYEFDDLRGAFSIVLDTPDFREHPLDVAGENDTPLGGE